MRAMIIALAASAIALAAAAEEKPVELKKGPGLDKVEGNCSGCHSLDYIVMNSPFPNAALGRRGHQDDQGVRSSDQRRRRQGHRGLPEAELRQLTLVDFGSRTRRLRIGVVTAYFLA